jgi:hypothetical protein
MQRHAQAALGRGTQSPNQVSSGHQPRRGAATRNDIQCFEMVSLLFGAAGDETAFLSEESRASSDRQGLGGLKRQERRKWRFCAKNTDSQAREASDRHTHILAV